MSTSPVNPGDILAGKYRVERLLGMGNMGVVVAATHLGLEQRVALKFMLGQRSAGSENHQRFLREARACSRLRSQHVTRVSDVGTLESGAPYIVMELLEGRDLASELETRGPLPITEAVDYILQACEAVGEAHGAGIVHRDLKPANLFLTAAADGSPCIKVLDFGVSKLIGSELALTKTSQAIGSPLYMSPEQINDSHDVDGRSDLWSLGVTLFELVGGVTPFHAESIPKLCTRICLTPPTSLSTLRPDAPPGFEAALNQCFEKQRDRRYPNAATLAAALAPFASPSSVVYAERVARVVGENITPSRPTDVLPPDPSTFAGAAAIAVTARSPTMGVATTGGALVRPSQATDGRRRASLIAALGLLVVALTIGGVALSRRGAPESAHAAGSATATTLAATTSTAPPAPDPTSPVSAPPPEPPVAPATAVPTVIASASATVTRPPPLPKVTAPVRGPAPKVAGPAPSPAPQKDPYAR